MQKNLLLNEVIRQLRTVVFSQHPFWRLHSILFSFCFFHYIIFLANPICKSELVSNSRAGWGKRLNLHHSEYTLDFISI